MENIKIKTIIEILGTPKELVEETINKVLSLIKESKKFELVEHTIAPSKQIESGIDEAKNVWSTFGEFEIAFKNVEDITSFCFEFMPSSIEILEPEKIKVDARDLENSFNDTLAKLHQYDMTLKKIILQQRANTKKST